MSRSSSHYRMIDRVLDGRLDALLRQHYAETSSWEEVARRLLVDHQIVVTGQTLRRWAKTLGIDDNARAAS